MPAARASSLWCRALDRGQALRKRWCARRDRRRPFTIGRLRRFRCCWEPELRRRASARPRRRARMTIVGSPLRPCCLPSRWPTGYARTAFRTSTAIRLRRPMTGSRGSQSPRCRQRRSSRRRQSGKQSRPASCAPLSSAGGCWGTPRRSWGTTSRWRRNSSRRCSPPPGRSLRPPPLAPSAPTQAARASSMWCRALARGQALRKRWCTRRDRRRGSELRRLSSARPRRRWRMAVMRSPFRRCCPPSGWPTGYARRARRTPTATPPRRATTGSLGSWSQRCRPRRSSRRRQSAK